MTTFTLEESPEIPDLPAFETGTILDAVVQSVKVKDAPWKNDDGSQGQQVEFVFDLPGYTFTGSDGKELTRRAFGRTSTTFTNSSKCKLRAWVQEIMGADELPPGYRLELENLIGNPCKVVLEKNEWEDKKSPMRQDGTYPIKQGNRVTDVLREGSKIVGADVDASKFAARTTVSDFGEEPF